MAILYKAASFVKKISLCSNQQDFVNKYIVFFFIDQKTWYYSIAILYKTTFVKKMCFVRQDFVNN